MSTPEEKPRPLNPPCSTCRHSKTFHPRDAKKHRCPCKAYGCACTNFKT